MRTLIKRCIPEVWRQHLRAQQKQFKRWQRKRRQHYATRYTQAELAEMLVALGLRAGDDLLVHSALGEFNRVEGGAQAVLTAIQSVIGAQATLLVPTFPHWHEMVQRRAFDLSATPSQMGVLTELVRNDSRAYRSLHPTHPIAALGPHAKDYTASHALSPRAFSEHSPFFKHAQRNGKILLLGVGLNSLTSFHVYEDMLPITPCFHVYEDEPRPFEITDTQGKTSVYTGYIHNRPMTKARDVERLRAAFTSAGCMKTHYTDLSQLNLLEAKGMVQTCLRELQAGRSAYGSIAIDDTTKHAVKSALDALDGESNSPAIANSYPH